MNSNSIEWKFLMSTDLNLFDGVEVGPVEGFDGDFNQVFLYDKAEHFERCEDTVNAVCHSVYLHYKEEHRDKLGCVTCIADFADKIEAEKFAKFIQMLLN